MRDYDMGGMAGFDWQAARCQSAEDEIKRLHALNSQMLEALEWYAEQTRLCRLIHKDGDAGRHALATDGGIKARAAIAAAKEQA